MAKIRLAIFASGKGSNALRLIEHFRDHEFFEVAFLLANKKDAPVLSGTREKGVETLSFTNEQVSTGEFLLEVCTNQGIDAILLAGYLRKIPLELINHYPRRILNIHPAILPDFGGQGMYGMNVHNAVMAAAIKKSGITIHFVDANYDEGDYIAQIFTDVTSDDNPESLAKRINELELTYYPIVAEKTLLKLFHD